MKKCHNDQPPYNWGDMHPSKKLGLHPVADGTRAVGAHTHLSVIRALKWLRYGHSDINAAVAQEEGEE